MNQIELFRQSLPERPYCADEFPLQMIRDKASAMRRRYIQPNAPWDLRWLLYDVDRETSLWDWQEKRVAAPNIVAMNRDNGHAHLFYGLAVPVHERFGGRRPKDHPLRYAASIDVAMTEALEADPGYVKHLAKNPLHDSWHVQTFQDVPYELGWLADYLDLEPYRDKRRNLPEIGLGRNCTLFDRVRMWAYREIRGIWQDSLGLWTYDLWFASVVKKAEIVNMEFTPSLPHSEVKATAKSIARYVWEHMTPEGFRAWGDNRRAKSLKVRRAKAQERREMIIEAKLSNPLLSQRAIAAIVGVSVWTVNQALKDVDNC